MNKTTLLKWLKDGQITIPAALLSEYKAMNIDENELVLLLQLMSYLEKGNEFPTPVELSSTMTLEALDCSNKLRTLIQKGFIEIIEGYTSEGIRYEKYSIEPLWEKLIDQFILQEKRLKGESQQQEELDLYSCFEKEFGRPLSPFECESLAMWLDDDHHDPIIIKSALREAVISGKLNFRYIDRILFEWKKNNIKTIDQAKSYGKKFRQYQNNKQKGENSPPHTLPFYNWLEN